MSLGIRRIKRPSELISSPFEPCRETFGRSRQSQHPGSKTAPRITEFPLTHGQMATSQHQPTTSSEGSAFEDPWLDDSPLSFTSKRRETHAKSPQSMRMFAKLTSPRGNTVAGVFGKRVSKPSMEGDVDALSPGSSSVRGTASNVLRKLRSSGSTGGNEAPSSPSK